MTTPVDFGPDNVICYLWLEMVFGSGSPKPLQLVRKLGSCRELYYAMHDPDCAFLDDGEKRRFRQCTLQRAAEVLGYCEKNRIGILTWESCGYPERLRNIFNPPAVLFYRGDPQLLHEQLLLSVVGTRHPSEYSMQVGQWLCTNLARCGMVLASGCALGLDSIAHQSCLNVGTPTVGVMGCGIDVDYPAGNGAMRAAIAEKGLLITEYFPGSRPNPGHFPVRNRILAGISEAVLVLEASMRSGSLITANLACEQGKQVFCVPPHDLLDPRYEGVCRFLRDGASPVFDHADVLYSYYLNYPHRLAQFDAEATRSQDSLVFAGEEEAQTHRTRSAAETGKAPKSRMKTSPEPQKAPSVPKEATPEQRRVLELLARGGQNVNAICTLLDMEFSDASFLLTEMELIGWIVNTERDVYVLAGSER